MPCAYRASTSCGRPNVYGQNFCIFHLWSEPLAPNVNEYSLRQQWKSEFPQLIAQKDGQWTGFVFPAALTLSDQKIDFEVNAIGAVFNESVAFEKVDFAKRVNFQNASFKSSFVGREVKFHEGCHFEYASFKDVFELSHTHAQHALFYRAQFEGPVLLRAYFAGPVNFAQAHFGGRAHFVGWRNINVAVQSAVSISTVGSANVSTSRAVGRLSRLIHSVRAYANKSLAALGQGWRHVKTFCITSWAEMLARVTALQQRFARKARNTDVFDVFGAEVEFTDVNFAAPSLVSFSGVNLTQAYVRGTNFRGAQFLEVNWWQSKLRRNGVHDDLLIRGTVDGPFRWKNLPILEETYRNIRLALEENKNYVAAADFYIGELDAHRAHLGFWRGTILSVPAWYRALTIYGTSVGRGVVVLISLVLAYVFITLALANVELERASDVMPGALLKAVRLATFQQEQPEPNLVQNWIDTMFRLLSTIQIALLVFAFRTRIKRH